MRSLVRLALLLALTIPAAKNLSAQNSPDQTPPPQTSSSSSQSQSEQTPTLSQQEMTVQERIRLRREQRRQQAIRDTYSHRYDAYLGMGYLRFTPGKYLQKVTMYAWDTGMTRYENLHLGITADVRGYYGTPFIYPNPITNGAVTRPAISHYDFLVGPTYRLILHPKYALSVRGLGGYALGDFTGDTNGFGRICTSGTNQCYLWPDGGSFAVTGEILGEYNVTPGLALRLGGNDYVTGFGSTMQNGVGFTAGFVLRFGKQ
jgi:hypothetical protein